MMSSTVGVIGAGTMGRGIAQVFAMHGYPVTLVDTEEGILLKALDRIRERTDPEMLDKVTGLIKTSTDLKSLAGCQLVIEAVFEDMGVKKEVFRRISSIVDKDAVIATNTSALSINEMASAVDNPARFVGMHFMNPPKVMRLVEVIKGEKTSEATVNRVMETAHALEKIPTLANDAPGFISNRLLFALIGEALRLLESGTANKEDIDVVMKFGMNHPMGPIELADFIGLDVCLHIMERLYEGLKDDRYRPTEALKSLVSAGKLGKKTKEGFYNYH